MSDDIGYIREALGRIEQKIDSHVNVVEAHVARDEVVQKAFFERLETLQLSHAQQKGAAKVWGIVASGLGAGAGVLGSIGLAWLKSKHT